MTYQVTPGTTKARQALAFGLELHKACTARDVSFKELARKLGVGHTTLWHYRFGHTLPRMARAAELSAALDWPALRELVLEARTRTCARKGCGGSLVAAAARRTPAEKATSVAKAKASYPAERRSAVSTAMHAARRQEAV